LTATLHQDVAVYFKFPRFVFPSQKISSALLALLPEREKVSLHVSTFGQRGHTNSQRGTNDPTESFDRKPFQKLSLNALGNHKEEKTEEVHKQIRDDMDLEWRTPPNGSSVKVAEPTPLHEPKAWTREEITRHIGLSLCVRRRLCGSDTHMPKEHSI